MTSRTVALVLLVGEQPAPNLLPTKRLQPGEAVLVHTDRTQQIAENLKELLKPTCRCTLCRVVPFDIPEIVAQLRSFLDKHVADCALMFNPTGGTKPMALAAFLLALERRAPFIYFQTEGGRSLLYRYTLSPIGKVQLERQEALQEAITLDEYLRMYVGSYTTEEPRTDFERQIYRILQDIPELEVLSGVRPQGLEALEVDFMVRLGNQVGVVEAKTKGAKSGIDQIQAVAEQRFLGTYMKKFLVSGKPIDRNNKNLAKAYGVSTIELASYGETGRVSEEESQKLVRAVKDRLGG